MDTNQTTTIITSSINKTRFMETITINKWVKIDFIKIIIIIITRTSTITIITIMVTINSKTTIINNTTTTTTTTIIKIIMEINKNKENSILKNNFSLQIQIQNKRKIEQKNQLNQEINLKLKN